MDFREVGGLLVSTGRDRHRQHHLVQVFGQGVDPLREVHLDLGLAGFLENLRCVGQLERYVLDVNLLQLEPGVRRSLLDRGVLLQVLFLLLFLVLFLVLYLVRFLFVCHGIVALYIWG